MNKKKKNKTRQGFGKLKQRNIFTLFLSIIQVKCEILEAISLFVVFPNDILI